jgi:hypothetical protein
MYKYVKHIYALKAKLVALANPNYLERNQVFFLVRFTDPFL